MAKRLTILGVLLLTCSLSAQSDLLDVFIPSSPTPCNGRPYVATWTNPWGPVYLVGGHLFIGAGRGIRADIGTQLYRVSASGQPTAMVRIGMWDHYQDPTGVNDNWLPVETFGHYYTIKPGEKLELHYGCAMVGPQDGPAIEVFPGYAVAPFDYFYNIQGVLQQAFLKVVFERPGEILRKIYDLLRTRP